MTKCKFKPWFVWFSTYKKKRKKFKIIVTNNNNNNNNGMGKRVQIKEKTFLIGVAIFCLFCTYL